MPVIDKPTVMIVDDEPFNLDIISEYLADQDYNLKRARDGASAWHMLLDDPEHVDTVLLDRMMPRMDGIEVLRHMKKHPTLKTVPVIFQSARIASEDIAEGIKAGCYYYLTKPFTEDVLTAIVATAVRDHTKRRALLEQLAHTSHSLTLMRSGVFRLRTLEEAKSLASTLAGACPNADSAIIGISELLINAVEHGNLGIDFDEKSRLLKLQRWDEEISQRLQQPQYFNKWVTVTFQRSDTQMILVIEDEGDGFDWRKYLTLSPQRSSAPNGRGIPIARALSFDQLEYLGKGNTVRAILQLPRYAATS